MNRAFAYSHFLILPTGRSKRYPFLLLSLSGIVAYFVDRASAEDFIHSQGSF